MSCRRASLVAPILFAGAVPGHACSVCFARDSANTDAFTLSTIFLSLLPLLAVGGTILWIRQALRQQDEDALRPAR